MAVIRKPIVIRPLDLGEAIVCGNAVDGHGVSHLRRHKAPGLTWKTSNSTSVWARGDLGTTQSIDFCALVAANALPDTKIRLRLGNTQAEVDGGAAPYDSTALDFISPAVTTEDGLYHSHLELPSIVSARWWRIDITGHTGAFEASNLVLGAQLIPSHFYNPDYEHAGMDLGDIEFTNFGVPDETPGLLWRTIEFTLGWQTEDEYETKWRALAEKTGRRIPIYLVFDPEPTAYRQNRTYMGFFDKPISSRGARKPRNMEQEFKVISYI